ncbi:MAG: bacteriohemerythrin [Candidatus Margulisiibacteriota bacterium]
MPISWTKEMSVGVREIDEQHQYFLGMLNDLYQSYLFHKTINLGEAIKKLVDYANLHFSTEEKYFDLFQFEGAAEHKRVHRELLAKVGVLVARYEKGEADIVGQMVEFLENWLTDHLIIMDKQYTRCFNEHGLY